MSLLTELENLFFQHCTTNMSRLRRLKGRKGVAAWCSNFFAGKVRQRKREKVRAKWHRHLPSHSLLRLFRRVVEPDNAVAAPRARWIWGYARSIQPFQDCRRFAPWPLAFDALCAGLCLTLSDFLICSHTVRFLWGSEHLGSNGNCDISNIQTQLKERKLL